MPGAGLAISRGRPSGEGREGLDDRRVDASSHAQLLQDAPGQHGWNGRFAFFSGWGPGVQAWPQKQYPADAPLARMPRARKKDSQNLNRVRQFTLCHPNGWKCSRGRKNTTAGTIPAISFRCGWIPGRGHGRHRWRQPARLFDNRRPLGKTAIAHTAAPERGRARGVALVAPWTAIAPTPETPGCIGTVGNYGGR